MSSTVHAVRHTSGALFNALAELGSVRMRPPRDARAAAHRLAGALGTIARALDLRITTHGSAPRTTALIVANHVGELDPIALLPVCPAVPVLPRSIARWPIAGALATAFGVIFADEPDRIRESLEAGVSVLDFAGGALPIARSLCVPIVPVNLVYRGERYLSRPFVEIAIEFGTPMSPRANERIARAR